MKSRLVVDTGPMLLYFAGNLEVKEVFSKIMSGRAEVYTCETNVAELYCKTCERLGRETAAIRQASIRNSGLSVVPLDQRLALLADSLKLALASFASEPLGSAPLTLRRQAYGAILAIPGIERAEPDFSAFADRARLTSADPLYRDRDLVKELLRLHYAPKTGRSRGFSRRRRLSLA